jgi:heparosan-N-sulfate-glucuronate 5-epimerase
VLEEYPTTPPSHVLNGWVFALWGLYDVAHSQPGDGAAGELFARSTETLVARLPTYEIFGGWSRYDVFPHPLINVASPFYHSLHVAQLFALSQLHPDDRLSAAARRWATAAGRPTVYARAVVGKVAFRMVRPRRRRR